MLSPFQFYLTKLAEEAAEVAQAALKAQQFGFEDSPPVTHPGGGRIDNRARLCDELNDLMAVVQRLNELGLGFRVDPSKVREKFQKLDKYLEYSRRLGMVASDNS